MRRGSNRLLTSAVFAALLSFPTPGTAGTIYSNLGPGDSFQSSAPGIGIGQTPAPVFTYAGVGFTPQGRNFVLTTIEIPLVLISGPSELDVFLMGDLAGLPNTVIESIHLRNALPSGRPALVTIASAQRPLLLAGRQYWVVAAGGSPSTFAMWYFNSLNERGPYVTGSNLNALSRASDLYPRLAFRVSENTITGLLPASTTAGGPPFNLTVNGFNFPSNLSVSWNSVALPTTYISPFQLMASVPASLIARSETATVTVGGTGSATFTVLPAPQPVLTGLSPASAAAGGPSFVLTVRGASFLPWSRVLWNELDVGTTYISATELRLAVPGGLIASAGTASLTVVNALDTVSSATSFVVFCSYSIAAGGPASAVALASGGTGSVTVTAAPGCSWAAVSNVPWVTISSGAAGNGNGTVSYAVAANSGFTRSATLTIAGQSFTISQAAAQPILSAPGSVVSAASFRSGLASGAWVAVFGANLSLTTRTWADADFAGDRLPIRLDGVGVNINGKPAYVYYISPTQLNVLAPEDPAEGPVLVEVVNLLGRSNTVAVQKRAAAPALFALSDPARRYASALFPDGTLVGRPGLLAGVTTRPAKPGDIVSLYASGLGPTDPPYLDGMILRQSAPLKNPISVGIGGVPAPVDFAGIVGAGLYQINLQVPDLPDGDASVSIEVPGFEPDQAYITIQR